MPDTDESTRNAIREKFGRELTTDELQRLARALPGLITTADRLAWWQSRLGNTPPAMSLALSPITVRHDG